MPENIGEKIKESLQLLQTDSCDVKEVLKDLQQLVRAANSTEIASVLEEIDLTTLFLDIDKLSLSPIKEDCLVIFGLVLDQLSPDYIISRFQGEMRDGLASRTEDIKLLWLKALNRCADSNTAVNDLAAKEGSVEILTLLVGLLGDKNESIVKYAHTILLRVSRNPTLYGHLFSPNCKQALDKLMENNDVVRLRVYDLMVALSLMSDQSLEKVDEAGYLSKLLNESSSNDPLVALNCIQLLADLALRPHGVDYLHRNGHLKKFNERLTRGEEDVIASLIFPGCLKLMGTVAKINPRLIATEYPQFFETLDRLSDGTSNPNLPVVIESIGIIGKSLQGKKVLHENVPQFPKLMKKIGALLHGSNGELKWRALGCLADLMRLEEPDPNGEGATITETWFAEMSPDGTRVVIALAKQPFMETRLAALSVIKALAGHLWGQKKLSAEPGFLDYILNRSTEYEKAGKEAKYGIVHEIVSSQFVTFAFKREELAQLKKFHREGPFYVDTETAVMVEGSR